MLLRHSAIVIVAGALLASSQASAQGRGEGLRIDSDRFRDHFERRERELREDRERAVREREGRDSGGIGGRDEAPGQRPDLCDINPQLPQCLLERR